MPPTMRRGRLGNGEEVEDHPKGKAKGGQSIALGLADPELCGISQSKPGGDNGIFPRILTNVLLS
jgi:hypothetical protein